MTKRHSFSYIRSATKNKRSIEQQRNLIKDYLTKHPELPKDFEEVIDNGYSGSDFIAPGIKKILRLIEQNQVDMVIVSDISRLSRNYIEVGKLVEQILPEHGVQLIIANTSETEPDEPPIKLSDLRKQ